MTLQVAFNNQIISNSVVFEYKARALPTLPSSQHDWLSLDGKSSAVTRRAPWERDTGDQVWAGGSVPVSTPEACLGLCLRGWLPGQRSL